MLNFQRPIDNTEKTATFVKSTNNTHTMKTRRQYLAYVRKEEAANVSPLFIMNERQFRGAETAAEKIARWEVELGELNDRMLPLILAGEDHRDPMTDLYFMTGNARRIDRQIRECESLSSTEQPIVKIC